MSVTVSVTNQTVEVTKDGQTVIVSPITQSVTISSPGPQGATGATVVSVAVGTTTTGAAGGTASVTNVGTPTSAILNFTIPQGAQGATGSTGATGSQGSAGVKGDKGDTGTAASVAVGATISGVTPSVTNVGTNSAAIFDFVLPKGDTGNTGATGAQGSAGANGSAATISVGTTTTLAAGAAATVTNTGSSSAGTLNFGIPQGSAGAKGDTGDTGPGVAVGGTAGQVLAKIDGTNFNTQWITPSGGGGSGVAEVLGTSPITASPSSGTVTVSVGTATTSVAGVVQLSDSTSTTSSVLAATPTAVKSSYDLAAAAVAANNLHLALGYTATTIETWPRNIGALNSIVQTTGRAIHAMFTPVKDLTVGTASIWVAAAATTSTAARMGLFTWDETSGTATLVARTANDTTIFGTAAVLQSRAFDTADGYPSTYTLTAGSAYSFGFIWVGTGSLSVGSLSTSSNTALQGVSPRVSGMRTSQTDLTTGGSFSNATLRVWGRFS